MPLRLTSSADRHGVPRRSTWYVAMTAKPTSISTEGGRPGQLFVGVDDRGIELEVISVTEHGR